MGETMSTVDVCCNRRGKSDAAVVPADFSDFEERCFLKKAAEAKQQRKQGWSPEPAAAHIANLGHFASKHHLMSSQGTSSTTPSSRGSPQKSSRGSPLGSQRNYGPVYFPMPPQYVCCVEEPSPRRLSLLLAPIVNVQVHAPKVAEFRDTLADDPSDKAPTDVETSSKKPRGQTDDVVPRTPYVKALHNVNIACLPSQPRPGFHTTAVDEEEHVEVGTATKAGQLSSMAPAASAPEELKRTATCHTTSNSKARTLWGHNLKPGWPKKIFPVHAPKWG